MKKWLDRVCWGCLLVFVFLGALSVAEGLMNWPSPIRGEPASGPAVVFFGALYLLVAAGFAGILWIRERR